MTSNKDMEDENHIRLRILSKQYTPDQLESLIGVKSDRSWLAGELRKNTTIKEKMNGWLIESRLDKCEEIEKHINELFDRVAGHEVEIKKLSSDNKIELLCAVYSAEVPSLYFDKDIVSKISALGANFDIDLYLL